MDMDSIVNGLAHELWAMAQGAAPIDDVVTPMMAELLAFAGAVGAAERERCQPNGLLFDALGEPRTRYVRVSLGGNHCVMHPSEGDAYLKDARDAGDDAQYTVADVRLSEREFEDLPEHGGF